MRLLGHASSQPEPGSAGKGRVSVPPRHPLPGFDDIDRPTWALPAPPGARWVKVPDGDGTDPTGERPGFIADYCARLLLPAIPPPRVPPSYGRPRRATTSARVHCQSIACTVDMLGQTVPDLARAELKRAGYRGLDPDRLGEPLRADRFAEAQLKRTRREYRAGRESLWREGVLPWAAWPNGRLPDGDWRRAPELMTALTRWKYEGERNPVPAPPTLLEMKANTLLMSYRMVEHASRRDAGKVTPWRYEDTLAAREEAEGKAA